MSDDWDLDAALEGDAPWEDVYMQMIVTVRDDASLLADPRLARRLAVLIEDCKPDAPGGVWGFLILPDMVRLIVGPTDLDRLDTFVEAFKDASERALLDVILRTEGDALDAVLFYNPVWGGAIYHVWQAGYHRQILRTEYRLSNALFELGQVPVQRGLAESPDRWPYLRIGG
ncbi:MAG TPA: hypothetical protein PKD09_11705 [Aggregatilinea sp.]|uniref:hypothetical protein n=1 Tax=Aggregatilinea sp. TaxID=2806333 RepID=UPI002B956175|nr:hypothetical protein [Aggregatilinea sp.]HML22306.1 hypothetical protein [Aggregatilinea sp.]